MLSTLLPPLRPCASVPDYGQKYSNSTSPRNRSNPKFSYTNTLQTSKATSAYEIVEQAESPSAGFAMLSPTPELTVTVPDCKLASQSTRPLVVFSGGTAFNSVAGRLRQFTTHVVHVLPVSDDGGSTAEVVRVVGGPAVGDIRSRCLRLADDSDEEARAVKHLLAYRLSGSNPAAAKAEWVSIVEGEHELWQGVSEPYKHVIRAFLVHFHTQILSHSTRRFNFCNGSIGNFFFAGSRTFFRSLEAAIFLYTRVARIPDGSAVRPAILTEERINLGAELDDGSVLRGQNNISHPDTTDGLGTNHVDKRGTSAPLPSAIRRVFYLSEEGNRIEHEVFPPANPRMIQDIGHARAIIYGMGSLYTSICPSLVLDGVGEAIAEQNVPKIMLLNGSHDRETSTCRGHEGAMEAHDMVTAVCDSLNRRHDRRGNCLEHPVSVYVSWLLVPDGGSIVVDKQRLSAMGVRTMEVAGIPDEDGEGALFRADALVAAIADILGRENGSQ